jgi:hypothetical protein
MSVDRSRRKNQDKKKPIPEDDTTLVGRNHGLIHQASFEQRVRSLQINVAVQLVNQNLVE